MPHSWYEHRLKYIMLLKLPIILSGNSFNFTYYSQIILNLLLKIYANVLQETQYLNYKTQNIPFIILIPKIKAFSHMLSWIQAIFDCGFEIIEA